MKKIYAFLVLFLSFTFMSNAQTTQTVLSCRTYGSPDGTPTQLNEIGYSFNGIPVEYSGCQTVPSIIVAVIDSFCQQWNNCDRTFGQYNHFTSTFGNCSGSVFGNGNCRNRPENYFIFQLSSPAQMDSLTNMLNAVPNGNYILAYTWYTSLYSNVPQFKQAFQNIGATQILNLPDSVPYIFFINKGDVSSLQEIYGVSSSDTLDLTVNISCNTSAVNDFERNGFSLFPNPVKERLNISFTGRNADWRIYNTAGQIILSGEIIKENTSIDLNNLAKGFYTIRIMNNEGNIERGFVKE